MKTELILSLAVLALGACSTDPADLKTTGNLDATARAQLKAAGTPETAIATWGQAIATLQPGSEGYFSHQLYVDRARYATDQALAELLWDRPLEARQRYIDALSALHDDVEQDKARAQALNDKVQTAGAIASYATALAGNLLADQMHTPYKAQQFQSTAADLSTAIVNVASLDWGGLDQIKAQAPDQLEVDFIRMPFFAHFHELASIGHLLAPGGDGSLASCTASLVGERLALTNAHCVYDHGRLRAPSELRLTFDKLVKDRQPTDYGFWVSDSIGVMRIHTSPTYRPTEDGYESDVECGRDWAILELVSHPKGLGFFDVLDGARFRSTPVPGVYRDGELAGDRLVVAGYSGDLNRGGLITMDYGCPILRAGDAVEYKCATFGGSSGSPILLADGPYRLTHVVGVNACGSTGRTEQSWRSYRTRDDVLGAAIGTPSERFIDLLVQLRELTGTHYTPSGLGIEVPLTGRVQRTS